MRRAHVLAGLEVDWRPELWLWRHAIARRASAKTKTAVTTTTTTNLKVLGCFRFDRLLLLIQLAQRLELAACDGAHYAAHSQAFLRVGFSSLSLLLSRCRLARAVWKFFLVPQVPKSSRHLQLPFLQELL